MVEPTSRIASRRLERRSNPDRRDNGSAEQWEAILDAAARVFHRIGYPTASLDDIANEVGLNRSSIYYYAGGKSDLLDELGRRSLAESAPALRRIAQQDLEPGDKVRALIRQHMHQLQDGFPRLFVFLDARQYQTAPDVKALSDEVGELRLSSLADAVQAGIETGRFRTELTPRLTARLAIGMCADARFWWKPDGALTLVEVGDLIADLLVTGMEKRQA
jgi:AcrR family transcriptional regulator